MIGITCVVGQGCCCPADLQRKRGLGPLQAGLAGWFCHMFCLELVFKLSSLRILSTAKEEFRLLMYLAFMSCEAALLWLLYFRSYNASGMTSSRFKSGETELVSNPSSI